jgi:hypothetical protein
VVGSLRLAPGVVPQLKQDSRSDRALIYSSVLETTLAFVAVGVWGATLLAHATDLAVQACKSPMLEVPSHSACSPMEHLAHTWHRTVHDLMRRAVPPRW